MVSNNKRWRNALIIFAFTIIGFYVGGGYRLLGTSFNSLFKIHHSQGDDLATDLYAYTMMFIFCGGAGALTGAGLSSLILFAAANAKKINPNREP